MSKHEQRRISCMYCGNALEGQRRKYCSADCGKYFKGAVNRGFSYKPGHTLDNLPVREELTEEELEAVDQRYHETDYFRYRLADIQREGEG